MSLSINVPVVGELIKEKLAYYDIKDFNPDQLVAKIEKFSKEKFVLGLRPFISVNEREKLADLFDYIISFLKKTFNV